MMMLRMVCLPVRRRGRRRHVLLVTMTMMILNVDEVRVLVRVRRVVLL